MVGAYYSFSIYVIVDRTLYLSPSTAEIINWLEVRMEKDSLTELDQVFL